MKSTFSQPVGMCVDVDLVGDCERHQPCVHVSDTKTMDQPHHFTLDEWSAFIQGVKKGEFDFS